MSFVKSVDDRTFSDVIAHGTVLVDFSAAWCGPCQMLAPVLEMLAQEMKDKVTIVKVDVDESQSLAMQYEISSVPTLILFQDGIMKQRMTGIRDVASLKDLLESANG
jgi:thioredoxin 1